MIRCLNTQVSNIFSLFYLLIILWKINNKHFVKDQLQVLHLEHRLNRSNNHQGILMEHLKQKIIKNSMMMPL